MDKDGTLTISKWTEGIGQSPHVGFGQMVNVDIFSQPGAVKISNSLKLDIGSVGIVNGIIKWTVQDPNDSNTYHVDNTGRVYKRDNSGTWTIITGHGSTARNGEGLAIWKDYLFYARRFRIDAYGPLSGTPAWTNDFQTLDSSLGYDLHPMLTTESDVLYIGNANFIDTLEQVAGQTFDPTNPATYVYNGQDLELASYYRVTTLEPIGSNIAIGTLVGQNSVMNIGDMFFWDGFSDFISAGQTIHFIENGVWLVKNSGNVLHTIAGLGVPRMFQSVTSQAVETKRFNNISVPLNTSLKLYPAATEVKEGEVLFGIGHTGGSVNAPSPMGVYSFRNGAYALRYLPSTLSDGSSDDLVFGVVKSISSRIILVSWRDNTQSTVYGVDVLSNNFYTNYSAYIESPVYTVGTEDDPKTFEKVQIILGRKLNTGDGIVIKARKSLDDTWTTVATFDFATYGARYAMDTKVANMGKLVDFQVRIEITTASNSIVSPELRSVTFS